jgi:N-acetylmuramoyl-L-alanine amidase
MSPLAYYLLKVIICSGIVFLYYFFILRNKLYHQWNRYYLLSGVFLSLIIPLLHFTISHSIPGRINQAIHFLQVVESDKYLEEVIINGTNSLSPQQWMTIVYFMLSAGLVIYFLLSLFKILRQIKKHSIRSIKTVHFINTNIPGTPFSFFNYVFWNKNIDLESETGQQIFQHEMVHVKGLHSLDKLFIQIVLILFWCNPFFWLIRKELTMIHEFIADKKVAEENGTSGFAAMILQSVYPDQFHSLTNQFFQSPIKRRLFMLAKINNTRIGYVSRLLALPLLAATTLAFTLRTKSTMIIPLKKEITVVVDAGHGITNDGKHSGAYGNDVYEDDIVLSIAKKIKELNNNEKVNIVLTRPSNAIIDLKNRVNIAKDNHADLFISIHSNASSQDAQPGTVAEGTTGNGFEIYVSNKETSYQKQSEAFGSVLQEELKSVYLTNPNLLKRKVGIWVLDQNVCPSVIVECGYLTDLKDKEFITKDENQNIIAQRILTAIERYATYTQDPSSFNNSTSKQINYQAVNDTTPKNNAAIQRTEASIDLAEWREFLQKNLQPFIEDAAKKGMKPGQYTTLIRFLVETDGSITNIKAVKNPGYGLGENVVNMMKNSPKWQPATENGKVVRSFHTQPITFVIAPANNS